MSPGLRLLVCQGRARVTCFSPMPFSIRSAPRLFVVGLCLLAAKLAAAPVGLPPGPTHAWYRHQRSGHLFQGRFGSFLVGDDASWLQVARYVHLNPVRVAGLGLGKSDRSRQRSGAAREPQAGLVARRLQVLRSYRWSSYRAHAGLEKAPDWLWTVFLSGACGGRDERSRRQALRRYHEEPLREGKLESIWERVVGGAVMGSEAFVASVRQALKEVSKGVSGGERWRRRAPWEAIVAAVEREHGGRWKDFRDVYGDCGRDAALYVGRHLGRMCLRELAEKAGRR